MAGAAAGASAGLGAPKRPPAAGPFRPPKRDGVFAFPLAAGVPAGVVEEPKLENMLPAGLAGAGVVEPRLGNADAGLSVPDAAEVSGLLGVGKLLLVGVELLVFWVAA